LNTLIPADTGAVLISAVSINDNGQIVALGVRNADPRHIVDSDDPQHAELETHVFVLTPKP
jgi:hypothetical protein